MEGGELQGRELGSVRTVISSHGQHTLQWNPPTKSKLQTKKHYTETRELHEAKKTVKDLTERIEESNSRARAQMQELEKLNMAKTMEEEWEQFEKVMKEVDSVKRELCKLKLDIASVFEEKRNAEKEINSALSYSNSVEAIIKEVEEINEEHVLVELARIEAFNEYREIEAQRKQKAEAYAILMEEMQKKKRSLIREIENAKELESKLAITKSYISMLESKLNSDSASLLEPVKREMEATMKELTSVEAESFEFMASMDVTRNELRRILEETDTLRMKGEKADMTLQSLNSKLLRAKAKLEASSAGAEKAKSTVSSFSLTLEQIKSEKEKAEKEESTISKETALVKTQVQKEQTERESAEERFKAAMKNLEAVKLSEAIALENLKAVIQNTMRNRALVPECSTTITISKFEYDYLKGHASETIIVAEKKVEAAQAWIEALKASESEIRIKPDVSKTESREIQKEGSIPKMEGSMTGKQGKVRKSATWTVGGASRTASFTLRRRK